MFANIFRPCKVRTARWNVIAAPTAPDFSPRDREASAATRGRAAL
jgi:hypothetical protein